MKLIVIATTIGLALSAASFFGQNQANGDEGILKKLDSDLEAAKLKGDTVTIDRVIADSYIEINSRGVVTTKADLMKAARALKTAGRGISVGPEETVDDLKIRFHGDTALISGRLTIKYQFIEHQTSSSQTQSQNPSIVDQERFLKVYVKTEGRWRLVAQQATFVAK